MAGPGLCFPDAASFTIEASGKADGDSRQHDVEVSIRDGALTAEPAHLEVQVGDMVLWHAVDPTVPGFAVKGEGAGGTFDSSRMEEEAVFTHAFGSTGTYEWLDANGGPARGIVEVVDPPKAATLDCEKWLESLAEGALVHIVRGKVQPDHLRVVAGQTVFWAVESATGISITDSRLLPAASHPKPPKQRGARR
jgi:plastocyanin